MALLGPNEQAERVDIQSRTILRAAARTTTHWQWCGKMLELSAPPPYNQLARLVHNAPPPPPPPPLAAAGAPPPLVQSA